MQVQEDLGLGDAREAGLGLAQVAELRAKSLRCHPCLPCHSPNVSSRYCDCFQILPLHSFHFHCFHCFHCFHWRLRW